MLVNIGEEMIIYIYIYIIRVYIYIYIYILVFSIYKLHILRTIMAI